MYNEKAWLFGEKFGRNEKIIEMNCDCGALTTNKGSDRSWKLWEKQLRVQYRD